MSTEPLQLELVFTAPTRRSGTLVGPGFNRDILFVAAILVIMMAMLSCIPLQIRGMWQTLTYFLLVLLCISPVLAYGHQSGKRYWSDIVSIAYIAILMSYLLRVPVLLSARLGSMIALKDDQLILFDNAVGVSLPAVMHWGSTHWLGQIINSTYARIPEFTGAGALLPAILGRPRNSQRLIRACLIAFLIGLPLFILLPDVGPWYGYHLQTNSLQANWQRELLLIRNPSTIEVADVVGIVGFPSFHVSWAIMAAHSLWSFRWLRIPAAVMAALITLSTLTGGYHYFADVVGGAVIAIASCWLAEKWQISQSENERARAYDGVC